MTGLPAQSGEGALDLASLFASFERSRGLLLAVSGGPDSTALLLLIDRWRRGRTVPIAVATVDHRLRAGSEAEAAQVAALCRSRGILHHVLVREGTPFRTRIQERARAARYDLLAACALAVGADTIVTAHHADDQAETVLMRLTRGSGVAGLAGMAAHTTRGALTLARPLLGLHKAELIAICQAAGVGTVQDPSNADPTFRRTGLRALASSLEREGLDVASLCRLADRAARADAALDWALEQFDAIARPVRLLDRTAFETSAFLALPNELRLRLFARELARITPDAPLRLERLESLLARLSRAYDANVRFVATLAGSKIEAGSHCVTIARAPARHAPASSSRYLSSVALLGNAARDA